eukprot:1787610-Rhodomonas_salina.5
MERWSEGKFGGIGEGVGEGGLRYYIQMSKCVFRDAQFCMRTDAESSHCFTGCTTKVVAYI